MCFVHSLHNIPLYIFYLFFNWRIIALQNCIKFFFNWRISALQCRVHFCCTTTWISFTGTYIPSLLNLPLTPPPSYPSRSSQSARLGSLCNIAASHEVSATLCSSHPLLPPLRPQAQSLRLYLYSCPANRFIGTIFLGSISVQFSHSVMSDSVTPWTAACQAPLSITNSRSLLRLMSSSQWCHPTISSSVVPFSSCFQSVPASGSFPMSHFFTSGGQSIAASASASVLALIIQDWFPLQLTGLSSCSPGDSPKSSPTLQFKSINSLALSFLYGPLSHPYMTTGKTIALTRWTFVGKVMSLLFHMPSRLDIAFLARSRCLLIAWLQSPSAVILEPKKIQS